MSKPAKAFLLLTLALILAPIAIVYYNAHFKTPQPIAFPALTGRVVDAANILDEETIRQLTDQLQALETKTSDQLVVVTVADLNGLEIEDYGVQLGRAWGIGQKGKDNGALLIVAPNAHKVRIEIGYGLEGTLTDAATQQIIQETILPQFRSGDFPGGITDGVRAIRALLGDADATALADDMPAPDSSGSAADNQMQDDQGVPAAQAERMRQSQALAEENSQPDGIDTIMIVIFCLIWLVVILFAIVVVGGRRLQTFLHFPEAWMVALARAGKSGSGSSASSSSNSSDSGGGGSDDSFSGGGGSFGGGGSSGSW